MIHDKFATSKEKIELKGRSPEEKKTVKKGDKGGGSTPVPLSFDTTI